MYPIISENAFLTVTETYVMMDDGVRLYTRIAALKGASKLPIVFIRTPYEKAHMGVPCDLEACCNNIFVQNGYAVVCQHCRGTGDSEGICIPYNERMDGLKTLEFIRTLPFYNGEIYLRGGSYTATVHLSYIGENPSDIKGAALDIQTDRMFFRNYRNGCNYGFCNLEWWLSMMKRQYPEPKLENPRKRPYKDLMKRIVGEDVRQYTECLLNDTYNDFWIDDPRTFAIDNLKIPVLLTEGWYDFYVEGMFSMWERLPEETKKHSALVVGPWGHATAVNAQAEYPLVNGNIPSDYAVQWFNSIRENGPYKYAERNKVNYYSVGGGFWTTADYPVQQADIMRLYFDSDNKLSAVSAYSAAHSQGDRKMTYRYNPEKRLDCFKYQNIYKAPEMNSEEGVLSFQSEAFVEETSFFGEIRWHMYVSSDCPDTAFFVRIYFVDGNASYNLTETITSLSHLYKDYNPGKKVLIDLKTPPIAFTLKPGMSIRVDIASDGGIYVPHANVSGHWASVKESQIANNSIYLEEAFIELFEQGKPDNLL